MLLLEHFAQQYGVECVIGSEDNVLSRFKLAVDKFRPEYFVRLTADNPLVNMPFLKSGLSLFNENQDLSLSTRSVVKDNGSFKYTGVQKGNNFDVIRNKDFDNLFAMNLCYAKASREHVISSFC